LKSREVLIESSKPSDRKRPALIKWKNVNMVRNHSFLAAVQEIIDFSEELDLVRVGIIGDPHSGKSTMLESIAHVIHQKAKFPYAVRVFTKENLINFQETLATLEPANYVLGFDDASFLEANVSKKQIDLIKQAISTIRHLPGGIDKKIILIINYHSIKALTPFLRQADFRFFTTIGSDTERDNMAQIMGIKYYKMLENFQRMRRHAIVKKYWTVKIGPKEPFAYKWRNPFIPVLFYNNATVRYIISPTRKWLDDICSLCSSASGTAETEISLEKFFSEGEGKFRKNIWLSGCRLVLLGNGMNVFSPPIKQAITYINRALSVKTIALDDIAKQYELEIKPTKLRKKLDGVLA